MGVCRGKISEGIDFPDRAGRTAIIVSIPYSNFSDPKVILKKYYLNKKANATGNGFNGDKWYNQEAT